MTSAKLLFVIIVSLGINSASAIEVDSLLSRVYERIAIGKFQYKMVRELDYDMGGGTKDYTQQQWQTKIGFVSKELLGFNFEILDKDRILCFANEEYVEKNLAGATLKETSGNEATKELKGLSSLYNSLITLRNIIPVLLSANDIIREVREEKDAYVFVCNLGKRRIQNLGAAFDEMKTDYDFVYRIYVDNISLIPYRIVQRYGSSEIRTKFEGITVIN
ncbi:hypothetical protein SAMN05660841_02442 [Sphingobacterium nematocida]|uniref:Outer membrane lipoprotein-sorting protein n=1 Tax=Sphingobacterium nematocida TaxID=1513896 RepID=A0A1T5E9L5_9SPHI|nr:hypothetical protein [Sphingobacterium nematocida]SKB80490.1 hypothetical protein SAMN05660841_02442 [Sphingobacterium nematocida]